MRSDPTPRLASPGGGIPDPPFPLEPPIIMDEFSVLSGAKEDVEVERTPLLHLCRPGVLDVPIASAQVRPAQ